MMYLIFLKMSTVLLIIYKNLYQPFGSFAFLVQKSEYNYLNFIMY